MKYNNLIPEFVTYMPSELQEGLLYISLEFNTTIHLCACGCKIKTVCPINKSHGWKYTNNNGLISLSPSIGNQNFECKSHYYITENHINWIA